MILTCPLCATRYQSDVAKFKPAGRTVRCANCGHSWFQRPTESKSTLLLTDKAPQGTPLPAPHTRSIRQIEAQPASDIPAEPTSWHAKLFSLPTLAFSLFIVVSIGAGIYQYRTPAVANPQQSGTLYSGMGLAVPPQELLRIRNPKLNKTTSGTGGESVLEITGEVVNLGQTPESIPPIKATLLSAENKELFSWTFEISQTQLGPSAARGFLSRIANPPQETRYLDMKFTERSTAQFETASPSGSPSSQPRPLTGQDTRPKPADAEPSQPVQEDLSLSSGGY